MGLGVALGAATRSFQDTTRYLDEQAYRDEQRAREREKFAREDAIRNTYAQIAKPGEEIAPVTVNGAQYDMTPQQAAIYRNAALNPATQYEDGTSSIGAVGPSRRQTEQSYMTSLSDRLAQFDPQQALQLRAQAKQFENSDMQLATQRKALEKQELQDAVLAAGRAMGSVSDEQWYRITGDIMTRGKQDGLQADVRMGEDGKPQMWMLTPDGKQQQVQVPGTREEQFKAMLQYLDMNTFQAIRKEEREDKRNLTVDAREDRKLNITEQRYTSQANNEAEELKLKGPLYRAQAQYYSSGGSRSGGKADPTQSPAYQAAIEEYNAVGIEYEEALQSRKPELVNAARRKLSLATAKLYNIAGKPRDIGKAGDMPEPKGVDRAKLAQTYLENNPGASQKDLLNYIDTIEAAVGGRDPYQMPKPGEGFFGAPAAAPAAQPAPAAALTRTPSIQPGSPESAAMYRRLEEILAARRAMNPLIDSVEEQRLRRLQRMDEIERGADGINSLYR